MFPNKQQSKSQNWENETGKQGTHRAKCCWGGGFLGCDRNVGKAALTPHLDVAQRSGWTRLYLGRVSIAHKVSIALMQDGNRQLGS